MEVGVTACGGSGGVRVPTPGAEDPAHGGTFTASAAPSVCLCALNRPVQGFTGGPRQM